MSPESTTPTTLTTALRGRPPTTLTTSELAIQRSLRRLREEFFQVRLRLRLPGFLVLHVQVLGAKYFSRNSSGVMSPPYLM
jgi:hypothetical protein